MNIQHSVACSLTLSVSLHYPNCLLGSGGNDDTAAPSPPPTCSAFEDGSRQWPVVLSGSLCKTATVGGRVLWMMGLAGREVERVGQRERERQWGWLKHPPSDSQQRLMWIYLLNVRLVISRPRLCVRHLASFLLSKRKADLLGGVLLICLKICIVMEEKVRQTGMKVHPSNSVCREFPRPLKSSGLVEVFFFFNFEIPQSHLICCLFAWADQCRNNTVKQVVQVLPMSVSHRSLTALQWWL